ncbi:MAG: protein kinase, partial [Myxococcales bacterium]|nr:protein kinase [Myxococcales bacterium]
MLLGGRYEVLTPIASGGMATVHLGRALGVGGFERLVAIKVMHPHIAAEADFINMFLDEARLAARIRHPNVVATLDVQADDGLFIVMEYVDGPSLQALRKALRKRVVPFEVATRILVDSLAGLHAAHELCDDAGAPLNLVHRDMSPANILIGADGVVRITDFGVARAEARLSSTRGAQVKGKVPYMPPEQLMGETVDRRCDVYAAGVVFWEMLTGKRLFHADNDGALVQKVLAGPGETPRQANPEVPAPLDAACMRALARAPGDRFATAADFADAVEHAATEAKVPLASSRALARFVEESGAHEKLDPRRLAQLKQAPESRPQAPTPSAPALRTESAATESEPRSAPRSVPEPAPSVRSGVTATAATVSGVPEPARRRPYLAMAIGGCIAVGGL